VTTPSVSTCGVLVRDADLSTDAATSLLEAFHEAQPSLSGSSLVLVFLSGLLVGLYVYRELNRRVSDWSVIREQFRVDHPSNDDTDLKERANEAGSDD